MLAADASGSEARAREGALSTAVPLPAEASLLSQVEEARRVPTAETEGTEDWPVASNGPGARSRAGQDVDAVLAEAEAAAAVLGRAALPRGRHLSVSGSGASRLQALQRRRSSAVAVAGPMEDGVKPAPAGADTAGDGVGCLVERAEVLKRAIEELEEKPHQQPQPQFHQQPQPHLPQQPQLQPPQPQPPQVTSPPPSPPMHLNCVSSLLSPASSTTYFHPGAGAWLCPCIQCMDRRLGMVYAVMG